VEERNLAKVASKIAVDELKTLGLNYLNNFKLI
jgi:hypothetical protein